MRALVVDVGSTSIRTAIVDTDGEVAYVHRAPLTVRTPEPGQVELDGHEIAHLVLALAKETIADGGRCEVVGVANQRASTVLVDGRSGAPVGPVLSWQDLRTVIDCLVLQSSGLRLAPNQSATKAKWLVEHQDHRLANLRFGTLETFVASVLSGGAILASDQSNAALTGLVHRDVNAWDGATLTALGLDGLVMPAIVPTACDVGDATELPGSPAIRALIGDQQASLFGQSCVSPGATKLTFGTGAMLDRVGAGTATGSMARGPSGCFPIVARSDASGIVWGLEGLMLSAGDCVAWLVDLGLLADPSDSAALAATVASADGVSFVPAFVGLGTPYWDFGARGAFFGLTRGSSRAHLVRAVLEGVAHRGADLIAAADAEGGAPSSEIRIDGGMSANDTFVTALANATGCVVTVSAEREATTRGAGLMALCSAGVISESDVASLWRPSRQVEPTGSADERAAARDRWATIVERTKATIPELSAVSF